MVCLYCRSDLSVSNSRPQKRSNQTWRRRPCKQCGAIFTSIESIDLQQACSVLKNGQIMSFDRDKLFISIYESLRHRPAAIQDARGISDTVTAYIMNEANDGHIAVSTIIKTTLNTLLRFDKAGASHYEAFHPYQTR